MISFLKGEFEKPIVVFSSLLMLFSLTLDAETVAAIIPLNLLAKSLSLWTERRCLFMIANQNSASTYQDHFQMYISW